MLIVNLCNQGDIYKQDNNNDTFSGDSDDSQKYVGCIYLFGLYNFLVDNVDNIGLANEGGFCWDLRKSIGIFGAGSYSTGKLQSKCCGYFDAFRLT